jgi:small-conductance mechanosensitive channel
MVFWAISLPAQGISLLFSRTFFSLQRPWLTTAVSVANLAVNVLVSALLYKPFGIAGIVLGFAAQRTLGGLFAGLQIALTQPVRIGDQVKVEDEVGFVEEITLTYVVVALWDLRRLVVPINYFIEKPFQNWTRTSADLLGTVLLYVDFTVPVAAVRAELKRIVEASPLWDRKVQVLQVTDAKERTLELRALASASDAGRSFDLRCEIREKLVAFLQQNYPGSLPRLRTQAFDASGGYGVE